MARLWYVSDSSHLVLEETMTLRFLVVRTPVIAEQARLLKTVNIPVWVAKLCWDKTVGSHAVIWSSALIFG